MLDKPSPDGKLVLSMAATVTGPSGSVAITVTKVPFHRNSTCLPISPYKPVHVHMVRIKSEDLRISEFFNQCSSDRIALARALHLALPRNLFLYGCNVLLRSRARAGSSGNQGLSSYPPPVPYGV